MLILATRMGAPILSVERFSPRVHSGAALRANGLRSRGLTGLALALLSCTSIARRKAAEAFIKSKTCVLPFAA